MNKLTKELKISIIVFAAAILGIISEFTPYGNYLNGEASYMWISTVSTMLSNIKLTFFYSRIFEYSDFSSDIRANFLNITLYVTVFIGGILYIVSKQKESRLIRFFFAIVLLSNSLLLLSTSIGFVHALIKFHTFKILWLLLIVPFVMWIYLSYWVLSTLSKSRILDNMNTTPEDANLNFFLQASKWQRFFHLIIDTIFCVLIFSTFTGSVELGFLQKLASKTNERTVIYILFFFFRLLYYPFWEILFGATPGKFLTETRVVNEDGSKMGFGKGMLRTISRFIPFEPFSFFGTEGWHDNISKTQVVAEKRTGMHGGFYFLIIPLFLILGLGTYYGHEAYKDHKYYVHSKSEYDRNIDIVEKALQNLTTDHLIKLKEVESYSYNNPTLKVEKIKGDNILVSIIPEARDYYNSDHLHYAQAYYKFYGDTLRKVVIQKSMLEKAYTKNYDNHKGDRKMSADVLNDGKNYEIECIDLLYAPKLEDGGSSSSSRNGLNLSIKNTGWEANVIEIKNLEGSVKWQNTLPQKIGSSKNYWNDFSLVGENYKRGQTYKVRIVVEDSLKRRQTYLLEGKNLNRTLIREN